MTTTTGKEATTCQCERMGPPTNIRKLSGSSGQWFWPLSSGRATHSLLRSLCARPPIIRSSSSFCGPVSPVRQPDIRLHLECFSCSVASSLPLPVSILIGPPIQHLACTQMTNTGLAVSRPRLHTVLPCLVAHTVADNGPLCAQSRPLRRDCLPL